MLLCFKIAFDCSIRTYQSVTKCKQYLMESGHTYPLSKDVFQPLNIDLSLLRRRTKIRSFVPLILGTDNEKKIEITTLSFFLCTSYFETMNPNKFDKYFGMLWFDWSRLKAPRTGFQFILGQWRVFFFSRALAMCMPARLCNAKTDHHSWSHGFLSAIRAMHIVLWISKLTN